VKYKANCLIEIRSLSVSSNVFITSSLLASNIIITFPIMSVYLLTGAGRGIGLEVARQLSAISTNIVITVVRRISNDLASLQKERSNLRILTCDLSSPDSISTLASSLPQALLSDQKITYIINNAAIVAGREHPALALDVVALNQNFATNLVGPAKVIEAALPYLAPTGGIIVNITSGIGSLQLVSDGTIPAEVSAYSISKCALNMLTVHVAQELKGRARVVCLDPGHVKTEMGGEKAVLEIGDSARGVISVVEGLLEDKEGDVQKGRARFYNFKGDEVPW
jgi:NAD(P)-dependent dehydrogenase (short-subunit alcohol dehydrogenase family)